MSGLTRETLAGVAAIANLAPSVHNTQPTRWRLDGEGALWLLADRTRRLRIGDPAGRDLLVSLGAALEATELALATYGVAVGRVDVLGKSDELLEPIVRLELTQGGVAALPSAVQQRMTWRQGFAAAAADQTQALGRWADGTDDVALVAGGGDLAFVSDLNERASLGFYRNGPYRNELLSWMRLSKRDPRFGVDGLSATALGLSAFEAFGGNVALRDPWFGIVDKIGLAAPLLSEAARTKGSAAVLIFHRPADEHPLETGRQVYRRLLQLTGLGFYTWPMAVLADDREAAGELAARFAIPAGRRIITAWRTGPLPAGARVQRERLPASALIV